MNFLSIFVLIPLLMLGGLWWARGIKAIRTVMVTGSSALLLMSIALTFLYLDQRNAGATADMLFRADVLWYAPLHISYSVGVDGISVAMLLLSSIIVFTGTFASWRLQPLTKEYFLWFTLLSMGVFGFFISIDLFTMFMFYEIALIPMYLLIGVWGSGRKEYAAMKLTLMLMGGSAFLLIGILGIYFGSGATTMNIHSFCATMYMVSADLPWFRCTGSALSVPYLEPGRTCFGTDSSIDAPCGSVDEAGWLRMFPHRYVPDAGSSERVGMDFPDPYRHFSRLRCIQRLRTD